MLTLHRAALLVTDPALPPVPDGAVLVDGGAVAALGPYRPVEGARVREWDGLLTPGLRSPYGHWLLERRYHPDPREGLGSEPMDLTGQEPGGSARRGVQRLMGYGVTAVAGPFESAAVRTAVARSGLAALPGDGAEGGMDPLAPTGLAAAVHRPLRVGGPADFAVFAAASVAELERSGAGCCLATVLGGRLVYRRR